MRNPKEDLKSHSNIKDINTNRKFLHLMQINDSAFPIGAYTHSFGMETYIQQDVIRKKEDLQEYCKVYLFHNLITGDALIVKEAYHLTKQRDFTGLTHLEQICNGIKLSSETREASTMMGRQFLQTVHPLMDSDFLSDWHQKLNNKEIRCHYPVVYGIYSALLDVDLNTALETFLYSSLLGLVQNAVRAVPLGQHSGVQTVYGLLPFIEEAADQVMERTLDDLNNNTLGIEIASMEHEYLYSRLFIS